MLEMFQTRRGTVLGVLINEDTDPTIHSGRVCVCVCVRASVPR